MTEIDQNHGEKMGKMDDRKTRRNQWNQMKRIKFQGESKIKWWDEVNEM